MPPILENNSGLSAPTAPRRSLQSLIREGATDSELRDVGYSDVAISRVREREGASTALSPSALSPSAARPATQNDPVLNLLRTLPGRLLFNPLTAVLFGFLAEMFKSGTGRQVRNIVLGLAGIREQADSLEAGDDARVRIFEGERDIINVTFDTARDEGEKLFRNLYEGIGGNADELIAKIEENTAADVEDAQQFETKGLANLERVFAPLIQGLADLRERSLSALSGLGEQSRRDITRVFSQLRAEAQSNLSSRGLGASNLSAIAATVFGRDEAAAIVRLNDSLARERINLDVALTTQLLGAQANLGIAGFQFSTGIGQQILGIQSAGRNTVTGVLDSSNQMQLDLENRFGLFNIELGLNRGDRLANLVGSQTINTSSVDFSGLFEGLGGASVPKADLPSATQNFGNAVLGTVTGAALGTVTGNIIGDFGSAKRRLGQPRPTKRTGVLPSTGVIG